MDGEVGFERRLFHISDEQHVNLISNSDSETSVLPVCLLAIMPNISSVVTYQGNEASGCLFERERNLFDNLCE